MRTALMLLVMLSFVYGGLALEAAEPIRVMTFNIRYGTANDGPNHWKNRHELVVETIKNFKPDLLGTQEVLSFQADYLTEQLPGYAMVGVGRDDGKRMGEFSSLFYDTERFTLVDSGTFWLSETPNMPGSKSWDASLPRVASWAKLKDNRASGRELVFINTHWDHIGDRARTESGKIIHTWMGEKAANLPTIVTGDFNVNENHPGLAALMSSPSDSLKLQDAFRIVHPKQADDEATFHGFRGRTKGRRIDFILTSPQFQAIEATIDRTERDGRYPSDHYPVTAILEYK